VDQDQIGVVGDGVTSLAKRKPHATARVHGVDQPKSDPLCHAPLSLVDTYNGSVRFGSRLSHHSGIPQGFVCAKTVSQPRLATNKDRNNQKLDLGQRSRIAASMRVPSHSRRQVATARNWIMHVHGGRGPAEVANRPMRMHEIT
jgi:hypothetical protein